METELTFVAPEGVYSQTEEQRPPPVHLTIGGAPVNGVPAHSRVSSVSVRFPGHKGGWAIPGIGRKEKEKDKDKDKDVRDNNNIKDKDKDKDKESLSSSDISKEKDDDLMPSSPPPKGKMPPIFISGSPSMPSALSNGLQSPVSNGPSPATSPATGSIVSPSVTSKKKGLARPKQSARTTSSTFLSRLQTMEGLSRVITAKTGDVTFLFYNSGKNFFWSETKAKEPFARIAFSAFPTCHDINLVTASHEQLDLIIGFDTGDLIWFDPILLRYMRLNKQGSICKSPCTQVRWVPGSPSLFLVSFADGSIITFDKERDDGPFVPGDPDLSPPVVHQLSSPTRTASGGSSSTDTQPLSLTGAALAASSDITNPELASKSQPHQPPQLTPLTTQLGTSNINPSNTLSTPILPPSSPLSMSATSPHTNLSSSPSYAYTTTSSSVISPGSPPQTLSSATTSSPSQRTWDPREEIFVTVPSWYTYGAGGGGGWSSGLGSAVVSPGGAGSIGRSEKVMKNPISHWKVSRKSVLDFVFSPDLRYVAAVSEDGCLRVIDTLSEKLIDTYGSYFGAFTCVAWSPDGRFIVTGGQDDLLTVISPFEQRVIARCQGHSSFVSSVAFDERKCDGRTYRFGSVGEDNKLIFWDFSSGALHRPKLLPSHAQRQSLSSTVSLVLRRRSETMDRSTIHLPNYAGSPLDTKTLRFHPAPSRNDVAILQPVLIKSLDSNSSNSTSNTGGGVTAGGMINNNTNNSSNTNTSNNNANNANAAGDTLTFIAFHANAILTVSKGAVIRFWIRPLPLAHDRGTRRKARQQRSTTIDENQVKEKEDAAVAAEEEDNSGFDSTLGHTGSSSLSPVQEDVPGV